MPAVPVDLRPQCPPVYDQGQLGSCTANAVGGAVEYETLRQGLPAATPSRLFIYWNERAAQGDTDDDTGSSLREGMKVTNKFGAPPETMWPYDTAQFAVKPPDDVFRAALGNLNLKYERVTQSLDGIRSVLQAGLIIPFGFTVYESFDSIAADGMMPMPKTTEQVEGGHAVAIVGDRPDISRVIVRNSWGSAWGDQGYFHMPYDYALNPDLASDFWAVQLVGARPAA